MQSRETFLLVFSGPFEDEVMKTENTNRSLVERFFSDEDFRKDLIRSVGTEFHRRAAATTSGRVAASTVRSTCLSLRKRWSKIEILNLSM